jgi:hypothetical protein
VEEIQQENTNSLEYQANSQADTVSKTKQKSPAQKTKLQPTRLPQAEDGNNSKSASEQEQGQEQGLGAPAPKIYDVLHIKYKGASHKLQFEADSIQGTSLTLYTVRERVATELLKFESREVWKVYLSHETDRNLLSGNLPCSSYNISSGCTLICTTEDDYPMKPMVKAKKAPPRVVGERSQKPKPVSTKSDKLSLQTHEYASGLPDAVIEATRNQPRMVKYTRWADLELQRGPRIKNTTFSEDIAIEEVLAKTIAMVNLKAQPPKAGSDIISDNMMTFEKDSNPFARHPTTLLSDGTSLKLYTDSVSSYKTSTETGNPAALELLKPHHAYSGTVEKSGHFWESLLDSIIIEDLDPERSFVSLEDSLVFKENCQGVTVASNKKSDLNEKESEPVIPSTSFDCFIGDPQVAALYVTRSFLSPTKEILKHLTGHPRRGRKRR